MTWLKDKNTRCGKMIEMNKIDLTPIVGSQILCEFSNADEEFFKDYRPHVGFLSSIRGPEDQPLYVNHREVNGVAYDNCRIYHNPDYWISNADGKLVLPYGVMAASKTRDGRNYNPIIIGGCIGGLELKHIFCDGDIIAVQVIGPAEGWSY
tara:strand:- start:5842 stop:6294 length:453 start_codon:yes stop_codon:yes gene_type:complete